MMFCSVPNCKNPNFSKDKLTGKGFCRSHQTKRTDFDRRTIIQKAIAKQNSISTKVRSLNNLEGNKDLVDSKKGDTSQSEWYAAQRSKLTGVCCNCGGATPKDNDKYYRWAIGHLFPKNIFKSIAMSNENWLEFCLPCHVLFDRNLATASEMKCFKLAVKQFYKFQDKITETHKFKTLFEEYANQL